MTWDKFVKEIISDRCYPETANENIVQYIRKNERRLTMGPFRKFNGILYCNAGTIQTKDSSIIDNCVERLIKAGNIERTDICVEYLPKGLYIFYIKNEIYSICYSSIISSIKEDLT